MKRILWLLCVPVVMSAQGISVPIVNQGVGEGAEALYTVSTATGVSTVGSKIQNRTYATGARASTNTGALFTTSSLADSSLGDVQWTNIADSLGASDGKYAYSLFTAQNDSTHYIKALDFNAPLPFSAVITGIAVSVKAKADSANAVELVTVKLVKAGSIVGSDYATNALVATTPTVYSFGGSDSLWGTTWTRAQVIDSAFGVVVQFEDTSAASPATKVYVDYVTVTVYYTYLTQSFTADTTQIIPTFRAKSFWLQLSAKDSISLIPQYRLSLDGVTWTAPVTMDSLKITTQPYDIKSVNVSAAADTGRFIQFIFNFTENAYATGTTTATYSAFYAIKRD